MRHAVARLSSVPGLFDHLAVEPQYEERRYPKAREQARVLFARELQRHRGQDRPNRRPQKGVRRQLCRQLFNHPCHRTCRVILRFSGLLWIQPRGKEPVTPGSARDAYA
jgi:hypothetical protein